MNNSHDKFKKLNVNNINNQTPEDKTFTVVTNTGATSKYPETDVQHPPSTNMGPSIDVRFLNEQNRQ